MEQNPHTTPALRQIIDHGQSRLCCLGRPGVQCQVAASHLTYLGPLEAAKAHLPSESHALLVQPTIQRQRPSRVGSHMRKLAQSG